MYDQIGSTHLKSRMKRLAFLGSGPSALYTCKYVLEKNKNVLCDIIEQLPVPFGLIRYGVAPDHQEVKAVAPQFIDFINENKKTHIRFFGNVCVGKDITLEALRSTYDGLVVCTGAQKEIDLAIDNNTLDGVFSAREFINWYNGYPTTESTLTSKFDFSKVRHVVIVGNGNVALDCARILAKSNIELQKTDISLPALEAISRSRSRLETISVMGRRGPVQAAFTIKELRELTRLQGVCVSIDPDDMNRGLGPTSMAEITANRPKQRILDLMKQCVSNKEEKGVVKNEESSVAINLKFLRSPVSINGDGDGLIKSVTFEVNELQGSESKQQARSTGIRETLPCDLLLYALGYRAVPISGLPFNTRMGIFSSMQGRIIGEDGSPVKGCYVSGQFIFIDNIFTSLLVLTNSLFL